MKRRKRPGELICRCGAYGFPHRFMGGDCNGVVWVWRCWENERWGACRGCVFYDRDEATGEARCQIVEGRDRALECPELAQLVRYEGVKLYGTNKPPPKKVGWRR